MILSADSHIQQVKAGPQNEPNKLQTNDTDRSDSSDSESRKANGFSFTAMHINILISIKIWQYSD